MKKFVFIAIVAVASLGFIGCGEDNGTTLKWQNGFGSNLDEIRWEDPGTLNIDQTWTSVNDGSTSDSKGIEVLSGTTWAHEEGGGVVAIDLTAGSGVVTAAGPAATIEDNANATLIIGAKK